MTIRTRLTSTLLLGLAVPTVLWLIAALAPTILDSVFPIYSLFDSPVVMRTGQHLVFTQPIVKHWPCALSLPPYAVFDYRDGDGQKHSSIFEIRGPDRQPLAARQMLNVGERTVIGPFVLFVTQEALARAQSFDVHWTCQRPMIGTAHTVLGPFHVPPDSGRDGRDILFGEVHTR